MELRLNWLIYGAGAIGTYVGASLILHGQNVVFLEQPDSASYLKDHGLHLSIKGQEFRIIHPDVYSSLPEVLGLGIFNVAIFALKSFDTQAALEALRPFVASLPPILCLQNGVENETALAEVLGRDKVIAGSVTSSISRREAGSIVLERQRGIGIAAGHPLSAQIASAMNDAGLNARLYSTPLAMKWSKMLTNLLANASCAILDMSAEEVLSNPDLYRLEVAQIREALAVMGAYHIRPVNLPGTPVVAFAAAMDHLPPRFTQPFMSRFAGKGRGQKMPSFHIDLHSGRGKSEVDYLNGAVARAGEQMHVATPVNRWLNQTLLGMVRGEIALEEYSHAMEKFLQNIAKAVN